MGRVWTDKYGIRWWGINTSISVDAEWNDLIETVGDPLELQFLLLNALVEKDIQVDAEKELEHIRFVINLSCMGCSGHNGDHYPPSSDQRMPSSVTMVTPHHEIKLDYNLAEMIFDRYHSEVLAVDIEELIAFGEQNGLCAGIGSGDD